MKKKILIIVLVVIIVIAILIGAIVIVNNVTNTGNNENSASINSNNSEGENSQVASSEFSFIFDFYELSEEWWNTPNEDWGDVGYTNREIYDNRAESEIGNTTGKLRMRPLDFSEYINLDSEYYVLEVQNNNFLTPEYLSTLSEEKMYNNNRLFLYALGTDLFLHEVRLNVDTIPANVELNNEKWKMVSTEKGMFMNFDAYYKINDEYCIHLEFPTPILEKEWNNMSEDDKDYYEPKYPYSEEDVEELVNKTMQTISVKKAEENIEDAELINVKLDDIKLDENITINMSTMKIISWSSDTEGTGPQVAIGQNIMILENANNDVISLSEYRASSEENMKEFQQEYKSREMEEYIYNNKQIYVTYYSDDAVEQLRGKYFGIMFQVDGRWYEIFNMGETAVDSNDLDIDSWVSNMLEGIISIA